MKIASVNWYVFNKQPHKDAALLEKIRPVSIGFQEVWRHYDFLERELTGYTLYHSRKSDSSGAVETAIALRNDVELLGWGGKEVSDLEPGEENKVFKSRWCTIVRYVHEGHKYAHINYHGNAAVQSKRTGKLMTQYERVHEWVEAAREIQTRIIGLQNRGYRVFVTGDWNYRRLLIARFVLAYWSPQRIFKRTGLDYLEEGLDYVAYPKEMTRRKKSVIPRALTGSDHPWIIVDVT